MELRVDCDLLELHRSHPTRYPYLLESVAQNSSTGRYDILFAFPGDSLVLNSQDDLKGEGVAVEGTDFLENFDACWSTEHPIHTASTDLPFSGGWFVYLGYELSLQIEPTLRRKAKAWLTQNSSLPVAFATRIPAALIRDNSVGKLFTITEVGHEHLQSQMLADVQMARQVSSPSNNVLADCLEEAESAQFLDDIRHIQRYIKEGDIFQVNLSRLWQGELKSNTEAADIYQRFREHNPAPFAGLAQYGENTLISSSPERLVKVHDGIIETRPIAGTRPRIQSDLTETQALLGHPKERAEHIMLIDLERNDLGRVCVPGSVVVDELMTIESYAHVHHIVSNVRGKLRQGVTPGKILRAVFPGGTITGCPKVRCMEIIAELEQAPRGAYTGSMGYINHDGSMDFNILIRTLVKEGQHITLRAGAGIVADSIPQRELEETRAKARGMLLALGQT